MRLKEILTFGSNELKKAKIKSNYLDALLLLAFLINKNKEYIYSHNEDKISPNKLSKYKKLIARRKAREPVSYIIGKKEFWSMDFKVNKDVPIPYPETEDLIEECITIINAKCRILDLCTGSGNIAIVLKKEFPNLEVYASDKNKNAINLAKKNAKNLIAPQKIKFKIGNLFTPFKKFENYFDIIITNPPYVAKNEISKLSLELKKYTPKRALIGGNTGIELIKTILAQSIKYLKPNGYILSEIDPRQVKPLTKFIRNKKIFKEFYFTKDHQGKLRIFVGRN
jgi:release factor glutamine methyltransferase